MNDSRLDDKALVGLIQNADTQAFHAFYDRYVNLIYSIAYGILESRALAEDITQEVFLRVWRKIERYDPTRASLSTWLGVITRNLSIDLARKQSRASQKMSWADVLDGHNSEQTTPEELTELNLTRNRVREALSMLPEEQREALAMAYFREMSHSEIAAESGEPLGTIKTRVRLGMQKLRGLLIDEK